LPKCYKDKEIKALGRISKLQKVRMSEGLTQPELAVASGVSVRTVARAEGGYDIKEVTWHKILKGLNSLVGSSKYKLSDIR